MKDGFIKIAAGSASIMVADAVNNADNIAQLAKKAATEGAKLLVMPELCLTGATCGDLFLQPTLQNKIKDALVHLCHKTSCLEMLLVVGAPIACMGKLFNCSLVIYKGKILGAVPKINIAESNQARWFAQPPTKAVNIFINNQSIPFARDMLFTCINMPEFVFAIETGEDKLLIPDLAQNYSLAGANVIVSPSATPATAEGMDFAGMLATSKRLEIAYVFANSGIGESTTDTAFGGEKLICQSGEALSISKAFETDLVVTEIDVQQLCGNRAKKQGIAPTTGEGYFNVCFALPLARTMLTRKVEKSPFDTKQNQPTYYENVLKIQANGLQKRIQHTAAKTILVGISGGLDSALALLVMARAMDALGRQRKDIVAVTMPCFGTTARTKTNAEKLCEGLGVTLKCVDIKKSVTQHFKDISHSEELYDATYENAQARERTQVLMDMAGDMGGFVVGTGDLSELALGWATFNGDHMAMYGVNAGIPKTLIRSLVNYEAQRISTKETTTCLLDILATPVSPELLPLDKKGVQGQKTEDVVGPYALHDFFLYNAIYNKFSPEKVYRLAVYAFCGEYGAKETLHWLKTFYRRFISQQFKRNCMPDGVRVFDFSLSPRGDLVMPSDAVSDLWAKELERIQ